ncbi:hypothetical protein SAMN05444392_12029 [Seinonella peptonophila]|uniref:Uncharacterized protein n=1 Tax=Seinonella peptonophila TaxID=112248 RepID=A0A1M5BBQ3_9BACL|nr:hypothetical protein [Seinonella peptonophila]SHF39572.1 hypothetical protein SAMN05444392_12029 [Seinonella peptonophila]
MGKEQFLGRWTLRILHNVIGNSEQCNDNDLVKMEAELRLVDDDHSFLVGEMVSEDRIWVVEGGVQLYSHPESITLRAIGKSNTSVAGQIFDLTGILLEQWRDGDQQRPAIVGTLIQTLGTGTIGSTYSFVAVSQELPYAIYRLPQTIVDHYADEVHRYHHLVWHVLRNSWYTLDASYREEIRKLDWQVWGNRYAIGPNAIINGSGEDFLFFHRQMVADYRMMMTQKGERMIEWESLPKPGESEAPDATIDDFSNRVPPIWEIPCAPAYRSRISVIKTDDFYWNRLCWLDYQFKNPAYLATLTLGELGSLLEFSVHNDLHLRWSNIPRDPITNEIVPTGRHDADFDSRWNDPKYDWLGEFFSSHVNPIFWRLHGWVDDRIEDWYYAHQHFHPGEIERIKKSGISWFKAGKWVLVKHPWVWPKTLGGYLSHHGHDMPGLREKRIESMKKVVRILYGSRSEERQKTSNKIGWIY